MAITVREIFEWLPPQATGEMVQDFVNKVGWPALKDLMGKDVITEWVKTDNPNLETLVSYWRDRPPLDEEKRAGVADGPG